MSTLSKTVTEGTITIVSTHTNDNTAIKTFNRVSDGSNKYYNIDSGYAPIWLKFTLLYKITPQNPLISGFKGHQQQDDPPNWTYGRFPITLQFMVVVKKSNIDLIFIIENES